MGNKGYCTLCDGKRVMEKKTADAVKKAKMKKLAIIGGIAVAVIAVAIILICYLESDKDTVKTTNTSATAAPGSNGVFSTTLPEDAVFNGIHAPGSYDYATISGKYNAFIEVENYGTIALELDADAAPITVANFLNLAESGFYNGLTFHRIMEGFMMQGGDPEGTGMGGSDIEIKGEFSANGVGNNLSHTRGAISMARNGYSMDSASSQFFIVHEDSTFLDSQYACFGYVTEGMDVVDAICVYSSSVVTDDNGSIPAEKQPVITSIIVEPSEMTSIEKETDKEADAIAHASGSYDYATISGKHTVAIEIADYGTITLELDADAAPITVANFLNLAENGFYNGLTFHRIMEGFMMQGGDPEGTGMGGSDIEIKGEFSGNGVANNLSHTRGAISMARNGYNMDSASSQFFIVHEDSTFLDGQYACFGYVTDGLDVVDAVCVYSSSVVTDSNGSIPAEKQPVITSIMVIN